MNLKEYCPHCSGWGEKCIFDWDTIERVKIPCRECGGEGFIVFEGMTSQPCESA